LFPFWGGGSLVPPPGGGGGGGGAVTVNSAGGTPAGSSSALQYNNAGVFGGTYNGTTGLTWNGGNLANTESINGITAAYNFQNTSTGTSAQSYFQIQNSANNFNLGLTGTGFTGTALTGGPTGQQGFISVTGNNPLVFGVNGNMVGEFTSTGLNGAAIGPTTANTGAFTTVTASGTASFGTSSDASPWEVLIHGATKGVRVTTSSTGTDIAGVDNTGSASYQPLTVDGSTVAIANSGTTIATFSSTAGLSLSKTIAGSTGAQTQNTITGEVQFAGAATSLVVTNSLCSSTSIITATICTNDATAVLGSVVKASGSFTINMKTAPTGTTLVDYRITN